MDRPSDGAFSSLIAGTPSYKRIAACQTTQQQIVRVTSLLRDRPSPPPPPPRPLPRLCCVNLQTSVTSRNCRPET